VQDINIEKEQFTKPDAGIALGQKQLWCRRWLVPPLSWLAVGQEHHINNLTIGIHPLAKETRGTFFTSKNNLGT
jgi:hypothetical protein